MGNLREFTVSDFTKFLKGMINNAFPDMVAIIGEVSNFSRAGSGHIYFSLKDGMSQIKAAFFKRYNSVASFIPGNGDKVKVIGEITVYEPDGSYQIIVRRIEYDSEGLIWKQFEETKRRLAAEGLFDESIKKAVPKYPYRAAVITSSSGAAIRDFIVTAEKEGGRFHIEVWNVPVQGEAAAPKIARAIENAGRHIERYDVIVVMRGGGSLEDLSVFNDESMARAAAACPIPVISAIGHERDFTIMDFVADKRAATPTAAAVILSSGYKEALSLTEEYFDKLVKTAVTKIRFLYQHIDYIGMRLENKSPKSRLLALSGKILSWEEYLKYSMKRKLFTVYSVINRVDNVIASSNPRKKTGNFKLRIDTAEKNILNRFNSKIISAAGRINLSEKNIRIYTKKIFDVKKSYLNSVNKRIISFNPLKYAQNRSYIIYNLEKRLISVLKERQKYLRSYCSVTDRALRSGTSDVIFEKSVLLSSLEDKLKLLNPDNVLERGYAVVYHGGHVVASVNDAEIKENIEIKLKDGYIESFITGVRDKNGETLKTQKAGRA